MQSAVLELLAALRKPLARLRVRWYLFGAQAALIHGCARLTGDVDVTVELGTRSSADLVKALRDAGFELRVADADDFVARTRVLPLLHVSSNIPVDVVLGGPGIEELFLRRAETVRIGGVNIPVARAEDLIAMKILAGRPKDIDDAAAMLAARRKSLDLGLVRETLGLLEQALDQRDLLPQFETLLSQTSGGGSEGPVPKPRSRKRRGP